MSESLHKLYMFLSENRRFNKEVQTRYYRSLILGRKGIKNKVIPLLYSIANTQSQPKMDKLAKLYKKINRDPKCLTSFARFVEKLSGSRKASYRNLFNGLTQQEGWGDKTAALFTKIIYHLHSGKYDKRLRLWKDAPSCIEEDDQLYLPVDIVITKIFDELGYRTKTFTFINKELHKYYKGSEIEVWDDLWFWGYITQKGKGENRECKWNPNKYWSLEYTNKDGQKIKEIHKQAKKFLRRIKTVE